MKDRMEHINIERINSYIEGRIAIANREAVENHLAVCDKCHTIYIGLKEMGEHLEHCFNEKKVGAACPEDWEIGAYVAEELPPDMSNAVKQHIKNCCYCIDKTALYYKTFTMKEEIETPQPWKQRAIEALSAKERVRKQSLLQLVSSFLQRITLFRSPIPAYVVASVAVMLLLWTNLSDRERVIILDSSEQIAIRDSEIPFKFGFSGPEQHKTVKKMEISRKDEFYEFKWTLFEKSVSYNFSIEEKHTRKTLFTKKELHDPAIFVKEKIVQRDRLYSWRIDGRTVDDMYFEYTGDFILVK